MGLQVAANAQEFLVPLVRPRTQSLLALAENPVVVLDEPEQVAAASERLWKRLDEPRPFPCPPEQNFYQWPELNATLEFKASLALRELDLVVDSATLAPPPTTHSRPSLAFHGNVQADPHRAVRRLDRVHSEIRRGHATVGHENRRDDAVAAGRISEIP